jgi:hypothetical protein
MAGITVKLTPEQEMSNRTLRLPIKGPVDVVTSDGGLAIHCQLGNGTPVVIIPHSDCLAEFATEIGEGLGELAERFTR